MKPSNITSLGSGFVMLLALSSAHAKTNDVYDAADRSQAFIDKVLAASGSGVLFKDADHSR